MLRWYIYWHHHHKQRLQSIDNTLVFVWRGSASKISIYAKNWPIMLNDFYHKLTFVTFNLMFVLQACILFEINWECELFVRKWRLIWMQNFAALRRGDVDSAIIFDVNSGIFEWVIVVKWQITNILLGFVCCCI